MWLKSIEFITCEVWISGIKIVKLGKLKLTYTHTKMAFVVLKNDITVQ